MEFRNYQREAANSIYNYFRSFSGNPLIVVPTAGGKSFIMAGFMKEVLELRSQRFLVVTHVKELIQQNYDELTGIWPLAPAGIYSAGLKRRDTDSQILFAGIQSVYKKAFDFQDPSAFNIVFVDEAHLISNNQATMYRRFFDDLQRTNPSIKIIGMTATPYRLDSGLLTEGENRIFTDICYEIPVRRLVNEGYLAPLVGKRTALQYDTTKVKTRGGEFIPGQLASAVDHTSLTRSAVEEIIKYGENRRSWLVFCTGIAHAENVCSEFKRQGIKAAAISNNTPSAERDQIIKDFKEFKIQALTNCDILTTGFNAKGVDILAFLRPTQSTGLYVQMCGRGMRTLEGKEDCMVLDFAGNIERHGPIDLIKPKDKSKKNGGGGEAPVKACPECNTYIHAASRVCPRCNYVFPEPEPDHSPTATDADPMSSKAAGEWLYVLDIDYRKHYKKADKNKTGIPSLKVTYYVNDEYTEDFNPYVCRKVYEFVCIEHTGYPRRKAVSWLVTRGAPTNLLTIDQALELVNEFPVPEKIYLKKDKSGFDQVEQIQNLKAPEPEPEPAPTAPAPTGDNLKYMNAKDEDLPF